MRQIGALYGLSARRYRERHVEFERFAFNPFDDIVIDDAGLWRWASHKTEMHRFVARYLFGTSRGWLQYMLAVIPPDRAAVRLFTLQFEIADIGKPSRCFPGEREDRHARA